MFPEFLSLIISSLNLLQLSLRGVEPAFSTASMLLLVAFLARALMSLGLLAFLGGRGFQFP